MSKPTIIRIFVGSALAVVAGAVLAFVSVWLAYVNDVFVMDGPDVVGIHTSAFAWAIVTLTVVALLVMVAGFFGGLVSWIGAAQYGAARVEGMVRHAPPARAAELRNRRDGRLPHRGT
jgi:hypothetical protein